MAGAFLTISLGGMLSAFCWPENVMTTEWVIFPLLVGMMILAIVFIGKSVVHFNLCMRYIAELKTNGKLPPKP